MTRPLPAPSHSPRSLVPIRRWSASVVSIREVGWGISPPPPSGPSVAGLLGLPLAFPKAPQWVVHNVRSVGVDDILKGSCTGPFTGTLVKRRNRRNASQVGWSRMDLMTLASAKAHLARHPRGRCLSTSWRTASAE